MVKLTTEQFIQKAKEVHGDKYDYSLVEYVTAKVKIIIICHKHGEFECSPDKHLQSRGCVKCKGDTLNEHFISNKEDFIIKANKIHRGKFDYSKFIYDGGKKKGIIICSKHGEFLQKPNHHLWNCGCPFCCLSKGHLKIKDWLDDNKIEYIMEKRFSDCKNKNHYHSTSIFQNSTVV